MILFSAFETRYDFDVDGNGLFRLFPSGTNHYPRCAEVRNSYGRRANDNLLLDYGFAMLGNQWDTAEVACSLSPHETLFARRKACLRASGQRTLRCAIYPLERAHIIKRHCTSYSWLHFNVGNGQVHEQYVLFFIKKNEPLELLQGIFSTAVGSV